MTIEYMIGMAKLKMSETKTLLSEETIEHLKSMEIKEKRYMKNDYHKARPTKPGFSKGINVAVITEEVDNNIKRASKIDVSTIIPTNSSKINKWVRMDLTENIKEAEEQRTLLIQQQLVDPIKGEIIDLLNKMTVDKYQEIKEDIFALIKDNFEVQEKLIEVLFIKSLKGKSFAFLYAKLCRDIDQFFSQITKSSEIKDKKTELSDFRQKLLTKSKQVVTNSYEPDTSINDIEDRYNYLKKEICGYYNFVVELTISGALSKSIILACLNNVFKKIESSGNKFLDQLPKSIDNIYLESAINLIDKYGTHINLSSHIKQENKDEQNKKLDEAIEKIETIIKIDNKIPQFIKYSLINITEKKKNGWELTELDKIARAKGQKELDEEVVKQKTVTSTFNQEDITSRVKEDLILWVNHMKNGEKPSNYKYSISDDLIKKKGCKLYNLLAGISELSFDFITNKDICYWTSLYFFEHCKYYIFHESVNDIEKIRNILIDSLNLLSDMILDNLLLVDFWGHILWALSSKEFECFSYSDIDRCDLQEEDQVRAVSKSINFASKCFDGKYQKQIIDQVKTTKYYLQYKEIFEQEMSS